ncbi:MAG TPA: two-component regulator propeller domain-containing protein [Holophagaceae bacterium]|nr:two-component regulator propeller domain-containing protein [Holophagaceae bacterium]
MRFPTCLRWFCACLLAAGLGAQEGGRLPFTVVGPEQGLPAGAVACIAQDRQGFLWLGSENGLVRHAAGQWRRWTAADGLPSSYVPIMLAAGDDIWIPSLRGLVRFREGRAEKALLEGVPSSGGSGRLALDRDGRVWATEGLDVYIQQDGLHFIRQSWHPAAVPFALTAGPASGALFVATPQGIHAFLPDGGAEDWGAKDGLPPEGPTLVIEDGLGRLWAGAGRTLVMKERGAARFTDQSARLPGSLSPNSLPFLDHDGSVWLPTQNGILHLAGGQAECIDMSLGLPFRWARTIFRDAEGTLWVVGPTLARLEGGGRVRNYGSVDGASGEVVWWVTRDLQGRLIAGTDDGAARLGPKGLERVPGTEGWRIKSLAQDRGGTLWMVSTIGPALWLRPGQSRAEKAPLGEAGTFVNSVTEDSRGRVWFGHARLGLFRWDASAKGLVPEVLPDRFHLQNLGVFALKEDAMGRLWAGSTAGLLVRETDGTWRLFTDQDGLEPHNVRGVAFLPDGSAWVHYQEPQGITRVRLDGGHLTVLEHRVKGRDLRSDLVYAVAADAAGRVWVSTDQGMDRLDQPVHVGREDGMADEDCSVHALMLEKDRVWVGTGAGLVRYDDAPVAELPPPQAHILELSCGRRDLEPPFNLGPVPHSEATLAFRVSAPTFMHEQKLRIQVRLLGLEDTWRDLEGHLARYPALPGGDYRFEARAARGEGSFGPAAGLSFSVRPAWWLTWWAVTAWGLLAAAAVLGILRVRLAALRRSQAALEAEVATRTEELRARNEELSSALTRVKQLSGLLPICSCCKKIRDDHGYWNQLESYIANHSEADFTHGICPDCAHEMFPDLPDRSSKETRESE